MSDVPPPLPPEDSSMPPAYPWPPAASSDPGTAPGPPLAYALPVTPAQSARPRIVTGVGVVSIAVAILGLAGSVLTAVAAIAFYAGAHEVGARAARAAALSRSPLFAPEPVKLPVEVGPNGLAGTQRRGVIDAFYAVRPLRPPRVEQIDAILARHGRTMLLSAQDRQAGLEPSPERVRGLVLDQGELFGGSRAAGPDYFKLSTGRLELYDDRAVFYPVDGSPTLRSALPRPATRPASSQTQPTLAPTPTPSTGALVVVLSASLAALSLSVVLFVAAVQVLRGMPAGRRMHVIWAWGNIAVTVVAAVAFWWMIRRFYDALLHYDSAAPPLGGAGVPRFMVQPHHPLVAAAVALVYPLAVLAVMRQQTVREYFNPSA